MIYNYDSIKKMAKSSGKRVNDYLVLSVQNDPFYVGQNAEVEKAKWFAEIWDSGIFGNRSHLRGFHYVMISREEPFLMPNGLPYENTDECWNFLGAAAKVARYLGLVDVRAFKDKRSQPARIFMPEETEPVIDIDSEDYCFSLELPDFPDLPAYQINNFTGKQKYMTEIWIEKSTMEDELIPLCQRYGSTLVTGVGELSITQVVLLLDRIIQYQRPCRILYISDFDPAGRSMPVAVSRKIEFYQRNQYPELDIQVEQVALTYEQCQRYKLPRTPIKETERRLTKFQAVYGEGATELDALEALYPGELARIVAEELDRFFDDTLPDRCSEAADDIEEELEELRDEIASKYEVQLGELERNYNDIKSRFEAEVSGVAEKVEEVLRLIRNRMGWQAPADLQTPEADIDPDKAWDAPLYQSDRDYEEQLCHYQKFKGTKEATGNGLGTTEELRK